MKKLKFPMYVNQTMMETDIDVLELSVRSGNVLRRAGYHTVGQIVENITSEDDLARLHQCGKKSMKEIMEKLLLYQLEVLEPARREKYLRRIVELNKA